MDINTSQNVYLNSEKAGVGERFLALVIDWVILIGIAMLTGLIFFDSEFIYAVYIFNGFLFTFYHFLFELLYHGQSLGKNILNIRIIAEGGEKAGFYQYLIRNLIRPVDYFFGLGLVVMIFNRKGQRLGDLAAGTLAIKLKKEADYSETAFITLDENYKPTFERYQLEALNAQHVELIKTVLKDSKHNLRYQSVKKLYHKVCGMMQVEQNELTHIQFLERVIDDFNYYQL